MELLDTWHVAGLRGTGSGDMAVKNIRVPKSHSIPSLFSAPVETGPLYTFPPFGLLGIGVASVALGNAQGALEEFHQLASAKKNQGSSRTLSERSGIQARYAENTAKLKAARAYLSDELAQTARNRWSAAPLCVWPAPIWRAPLPRFAARFTIWAAGPCSMRTARSKDGFATPTPSPSISSPRPPPMNYLAVCYSDSPQMRA